MNYKTIKDLWPEMCNRVVGVDCDGGEVSSVTTFGTAITMMGGVWYLPTVSTSEHNQNGKCVDSGTVYCSAAVSCRNALQEMAQAIDDALPIDSQTMQGDE